MLERAQDAAKGCLQRLHVPDVVAQRLVNWGSHSSRRGAVDTVLQPEQVQTVARVEGSHTQLAQQLNTRVREIVHAALEDDSVEKFGRITLHLVSMNLFTSELVDTMDSDNAENSRRAIMVADAFVRHTDGFDDPETPNSMRSQKLRTASLLLDPAITIGYDTPDMNFTNFLLRTVSPEDFDTFMGHLDAGTLPQALLSDREVDRITHIATPYNPQPGGISFGSMDMLPGEIPAREVVIETYKKTNNLAASFAAIADMQ